MYTLPGVSSNECVNFHSTVFPAIVFPAISVCVCGVCRPGLAVKLTLQKSYDRTLGLALVDLVGGHSDLPE
jgi:hypothetical protein